MNRKEALSTALTEDKNVETVVATTLRKDLKALSKASRDVADSIEEIEEQLEERLSSTTPLDKSVVEVTFKKLQDLKATKELYEEFEKEYFPKAQ